MTEGDHHSGAEQQSVPGVGSEQFQHLVPEGVTEGPKTGAAPSGESSDDARLEAARAKFAEAATGAMQPEAESVEIDPATVGLHLLDQVRRFADNDSPSATVVGFIPRYRYTPEAIPEAAKRGEFDYRYTIGRPLVRVDGGITRADEGLELSFPGMNISGTRVDYRVVFNEGNVPVFTKESHNKGESQESASVAIGDTGNPLHAEAMRIMQETTGNLESGRIVDPKTEVIEGGRVWKRRSRAYLAHRLRRRAGELGDSVDRAAGLS